MAGKRTYRDNPVDILEQAYWFLPGPYEKFARIPVPLWRAVLELADLSDLAECLRESVEGPPKLYVEPRLIEIPGVPPEQMKFGKKPPEDDPYVNVRSALWGGIFERAERRRHRRGGRPPLDRRERRKRERYIAYARTLKEGFVAEGISAEKAEELAADIISKNSPLSPSYIRDHISRTGRKSPK
jgi:hypothetical protein